MHACIQHGIIQKVGTNLGVFINWKLYESERYLSHNGDAEPTVEPQNSLLLEDCSQGPGKS